MWKIKMHEISPQKVMMRTWVVSRLTLDSWEVHLWSEVKWYIGLSWDILRLFCLRCLPVSDVNSLTPALLGFSPASSPSFLCQSPAPIENTRQQTEFYFKLKAFVRSKYWISSHVIRPDDKIPRMLATFKHNPLSSCRIELKQFSILYIFIWYD